jgi:hypothetical protein
VRWAEIGMKIWWFEFTYMRQGGTSYYLNKVILSLSVLNSLVSREGGIAVTQSTFRLAYPPWIQPSRLYMVSLSTGNVSVVGGISRNQSTIPVIKSRRCSGLRQPKRPKIAL